VALVRRLLALLPLMELSITLLRLSLGVLFLLGGSLLQQMRLHNLTLAGISLSHLALSLSICLLR
jgi:hypothetical protein